jgi:hypothetical protein
MPANLASSSHHCLTQAWPGYLSTFALYTATLTCSARPGSDNMFQLSGAKSNLGKVKLGPSQTWAKSNLGQVKPTVVLKSQHVL